MQPCSPGTPGRPCPHARCGAPDRYFHATYRTLLWTEGPPYPPARAVGRPDLPLLRLRAGLLVTEGVFASVVPVVPFPPAGGLDVNMMLIRLGDASSVPEALRQCVGKSGPDLRGVPRLTQFAACSQRHGGARVAVRACSPLVALLQVKSFSCCFNTNMNSLQNFEYFEHKHIV